jgi:hypothetical protein
MLTYLESQLNFLHVNISFVPCDDGQALIMQYKGLPILPMCLKTHISKPDAHDPASSSTAQHQST